MEEGLVKFELERGGELREIAQFFFDLERAYYAVKNLPTRRHFRRYERMYGLPMDLWPLEFLDRQPFLHDYHTLETPDERPRLNRIEINSPGWAEIIGAFNPLQQLREYLKDRHERKIDHEWRSAAMRDKAIYENEMLKAQAAREKVGAIGDFHKLLGDMGIPEEEKQKILWSRLGEPLLQLGQHQDSGLLGDQRRHEKDGD